MKSTTSKIKADQTSSSPNKIDFDEDKQGLLLKEMAIKKPINKCENFSEDIKLTEANED